MPRQVNEAAAASERVDALISTIQTASNPATMPTRRRRVNPAMDSVARSAVAPRSPGTPSAMPSGATSDRSPAGGSSSGGTSVRRDIPGSVATRSWRVNTGAVTGELSHQHDILALDCPPFRTHVRYVLGSAMRTYAPADPAIVL